MNMLRKISLFAATTSVCMLFWGCQKPKPAEAPEPDTETETAVDASWATFVVTDIDMMGAFLCENDLYPKFYMQIPGTEDPVQQLGYVSPSRDPQTRSVNINFKKAKCLDGRERDGTVYFDYAYNPLINNGANKNSEYYHEFGFAARISFTNFLVDGWKVEQFDDQFPAYIYNDLTGTKQGQYLWRIAGKFRFVHPTDTTKNIIWDGELHKTLVNYSLSTVLSYTRQPVITWSNSICSYSTSKPITGKTNVIRDPQASKPSDLSGGVDFKMEIGQNNQLVRDFVNCFPDKIGTVSLTPSGSTFSMTPKFEEFHPFVSGVASFTTSTKYPRQIYFGNEGNQDLPAQCDNTGEVLIKGIAYRVNFRK